MVVTKYLGLEIERSGRKYRVRGVRQAIQKGILPFLSTKDFGLVENVSIKNLNNSEIRIRENEISITGLIKSCRVENNDLVCEGVKISELPGEYIEKHLAN